MPPNPLPLIKSVRRKVRFEEVDVMGVVWHGRYPSYFEDARLALCEDYGIGYMDFYRNGYAAPLVSMQVDYHAPLRFNQTCRIEARLIYTGAAKLNIEYRINDEQGVLTSSGATIQLVVDDKGLFCPFAPDFFQDFLNQWASGAFTGGLE